MKAYPISKFIAVIGMMSGLSGCIDLDHRTGLDPILDATSIEAASANKARLLDALARDAAVAPGSGEYYYEVAEAGFDYVDDQCRSYFSELFFLDRGREQTKSGLTAASQTTAAILGITKATSPTLAIAAQAFGFATNATDIATGTYLYRLPPATTQGFVEKLQLAFRDAAAANRFRINSPSAAYHLIQRYLNLCLPPTIEAEITKQISSASALVVPAGAGSLFSVESVGKGTAPASQLVQQATARILHRSSDIPTPDGRKVVPPATTDPRYTATERGLFPEQIKRWQAALCLKPIDGNLGDHKSPTRAAIRDYLISKGALDQSEDSDKSLEIKGQREKVLLNMLKSNSTCP